MTVRVLSPEGAVGGTPHALAPGRTALAKARVAVLDNGKPHARTLMMTAAGLLSERAGTLEPIVVRKRSAAEGAADEILADLRGRADLVITGSAD
jgi:hypothetical protein